MLVNRVMLALEIHAGIDAALGAQGMGTLHRAIREEVNLAAALKDFQSSHKAGQAAAHDDNFYFFVSH